MYSLIAISILALNPVPPLKFDVRSLGEFNTKFDCEFISMQLMAEWKKEGKSPIPRLVCTKNQTPV